MDAVVLKKRHIKGEDLHTEFKEKLPDNESLAKSLVCFANADGGQLIIGVGDKGDIVGVADVDEALQKIDDIATSRCEPPLSVLSETLVVEKKNVVIVNIPKGAQRPYRTGSGRFYLRSGNRCRQASWDEVRRLYQTSESIFYDESPVSRASIEEIDLDAFVNFLRTSLALSSSAPVDNYLRNLKIVTDKNPTLAGLLFFGERPQYYLPFAKIIAAQIPGTEISIPPADRKEIDGSIPEILDASLNFFRLYLKEEHKIKGFESELYPEVPIEVLREAIVNAIAHRDYTVSGPIRVLIFDDRIEIRTPGKLPNSVTVESIRVGGAHVVRNPTLYNLLNKIGMVTDIGSGVYRMIKLVQEKLGKNLRLSATETEFTLTIPRK